MQITSLFVLPHDLVVTAEQDLAHEIRHRSNFTTGEVVLTRSQSRHGSVVVDSTTAALLEQFRNPTAIVDAVVKYSRIHTLDPRSLLDEIYPLIQQLVASRFLVHPDETLDQGPSLKPGDRCGGVTILTCVQAVEDVEVYQGRMASGEVVALKVALEVGPRTRAMFTKEETILRKLDGTIAPRLIASGSLDDRPYLVMEWCVGIACSAAAEEIRSECGSPYSPSMLALCLKITQAYSRLHELNILQGDIHPRNILVDHSGGVKLLDFGLAVDLRSPCGREQRGGVGFYFDPDFANALLAGDAAPDHSALAEQYSIGALLYLLITGHHYIDFSVEQKEAMRQIVSDPMLTFAAHNLHWPELEAVLTRCLAKTDSARYPSLAAMTAELHGIELPNIKARESTAILPSAISFAKSIIDRLSEDSPLLHDGVTPAPTSSFNYGAAGIAYAIYRISCIEDSARLLSLADSWLHHALARATSADAFYNDRFGVTSETVGTSSLFHGPPGLHAVDALISRSLDDRGALARAIGRFVSSSASHSPLKDITLGRAGILVAAGLLLESLDDDSQESRASLLSLGDNIAADLTTSISQFGLIDGCSEFDYLGAAHGWAGLLYSLLRWAKATNRPASQQCVDRSWELASLAEPKARGFRWPGRVRSPNVTPAFMPGWCNGSAGFTYLWTLNYRLTGDSRFLELAEKAAWNVWEQSDGNKSLCCGLAGRAYSLLNVWKWTGEPRWLDRARNQVVGILRESKSENPFRHSLYKGDVGIALVAYEIENPEFAMMPMFE